MGDGMGGGRNGCFRDAPLCDREFDWEVLPSRPISHPRTGRSSQPPRSEPLRGSIAR